MSSTTETLLSVVRPATGQTLAEVSAAGVAEKHAAIERAKRAFPAWRAISPADRSRLLLPIAAGVGALPLRALETGTVAINSNTSVRVTTPFGGFRHSGLGRELGPHALDLYTEVKNVFISTG